ncbi:MAG TPA: hypothetical protein VGD17_20465, partial [Chitinophagaceae bacterium]
MKKLIMLFAVTITLFTVNAQNNYAVSEIDTSLTRNANVVVRFEEDRYELKSLEKAVQSYKRAITILNEKGDKHAGMYVSYDMLHVLDYFEGSLYDAQGKKIRSLK